MKCPKFKAAFIASNRDFLEGDVECDKEQCAWWVRIPGRCSEVHGAIALQDIHEVLHDLVKKMPHEGPPQR